MLAARRLAVLLGLAALFTLPAASGAAFSGNRAAELREHAELRGRREAADAELTRLRVELDVARQSVSIAERRLGNRLRQLYQGGRIDPVAVLLGAQSLDQATSGLDGLRSLASSDRALALELRAAREQLTAATRRVAARVAALRRAAVAAAATNAAARRSESATIAGASSETTPRPYLGGERTMTVTTTGYAIDGRTSTGLQTGWGSPPSIPR